MTALRNWLKNTFGTPTPPPRHRSRARTRDVVIVSDVEPAEPPNKELAERSRRAQRGLIQSIMKMEREAADLNNSLVELTLKNFSNGGHS